MEAVSKAVNGSADRVPRRREGHSLGEPEEWMKERISQREVLLATQTNFKCLVLCRATQEKVLPKCSFFK